MGNFKRILTHLPVGENAAASHALGAACGDLFEATAIAEPAAHFVAFTYQAHRCSATVRSDPCVPRGLQAPGDRETVQALLCRTPELMQAKEDLDPSVSFARVSDSKYPQVVQGQ
jgi:hypothetical protein